MKLNKKLYEVGVELKFWGGSSFFILLFAIHNTPDDRCGSFLTLFILFLIYMAMSRFHGMFTCLK